VGALIAAAGLLFPSGSAVQLVFVVPGVIIGGFGWLALPVWPLVLARRVFNMPPSHISNEEGISPRTQARRLLRRMEAEAGPGSRFASARSWR
jgi:hypothetical protein